VDQKSFVIAKGIKDGISKGQELIFANENVSMVCKAMEVNRNFSYWYPVNESMTVPFLREEIVAINSHIFGSVGLDLVADQLELLKTMEREKQIAKFRLSDHYTARGSLGSGITQSASSVSTDQNSKRFAFDLSIERSFRIQPEYEVGLGFRYDNDVYRITDPTLDIPTKRYMALGILTYHFVNWTKDKNNAYVSLVGGLGFSSTTINETVSSGMATILPQVRLGYIMPFSNQSAMIFEGSVESISATESFSDGTKQTSSYWNLKATVGIAF
jgi:hypothetical protein